MRKKSQPVNSSLIAEGCEFRGDVVLVDAELIVAGTFIGSVKGDGENASVTVCETGKMAGELAADTIEIAGVAECNVNSNGKLKIGSTATVRGTLKYSQLEVEPGAQIVGDLESTVNARENVKNIEDYASGKTSS